MASSAAAGPARAFQAEQLSGVVSSVDLDHKKIAVTPTDKEKPVDVAVNDQTVIQTANGKILALKELKTGDGLGIAHTGGLASKIVVNIRSAGLEIDSMPRICNAAMATTIMMRA